MDTRLKRTLCIIMYATLCIGMVACGASSPGQVPGEAGIEVSFEEKLLATIPAEIAPEDLDYHAFSPDGRSVAYIAQQGEGQFVVVGDQHGETFDKVAFPVYSPDGQTIAYVAQQGEKELVVVGTEKGELCDAIWSLAFSPDSQTVAYLANQDGKAFAIVGGEKGEGFSDVASLVFGPNGKTIAYSAKEGDRWHVVVGTEKGPAYDAIGLDSTAFSPDGKTVGYLAKQGEKWFAVIDGKEGPEFDVMGSKSLTFGARGTAAYIGKLGEKWYAVVDDKKGEPYDAVWPPIFSPDGKHTAFVAREAKTKFVIIDGQPEPLQFDEMRSNSVVFSPDSKTVAYSAQEGEEWCAVVGQKKGEGFDRVEDVTFSPDGKTIAYYAQQGNEWFLVVGDQKSEPFSGIIMTNLYISSFSLNIHRASTIVFSPDSQHAASVGLRNGKAFVVIGNETSAGHDWIGGIPVCMGGRLGIKQSDSQLSFYTPINVRMITGQRTDITNLPLVTFSSDGTKVAYGAREGRELWWKVLEVD